MGLLPSPLEAHEEIVMRKYTDIGRQECMCGVALLQNRRGPGNRLCVGWLGVALVPFLFFFAVSVDFSSGARNVVVSILRAEQG